MSPSAEQVRGKKALVVGLGRSGMAAAKRLLAAGAHVTATDSAPFEKLGRDVQLLAAAGVVLHAGGHDPADFAAADLVVLSPGVPLDAPGLDVARARGIAVCSEIDLVAAQVGDRVVAITGSNGKSTTTAIAGAIFNAAGRDGVPCANYGVPFCDAVQGDHPGRWYAAELSSFQLEITTELTASAVALLNVQPDHLDRHGSVDAYRAAKERIEHLRAPGAPIVLCVDDPLVEEFAGRATPPVLLVSADRDVADGGCVARGRLVLRHGGQEDALIDVAAMPIPGRHNRINALTAAVLCHAVGVPVEAIRRGLSSFRGLPHRIQDVAQVEGVRYVDDSKATNVGSVLEALRAIGETLEHPEHRVFVLLGGRDKDSDFRPLAEALPAHRGIAVTFGEAGPLIADVLARAGLPSESLHRAGTMQEAMAVARTIARPGDVVLLSPACASFDAFTGYGARGDAFAAEARRFAAEPGR